MDARPARGVVLCLTKHLASYWRDIPVTAENVADHIQYGIAFGPIEVSMWHLPGSIAYADQAMQPGRVRDHRLRYQHARSTHTIAASQFLRHILGNNFQQALFAFA